MNCQGPRFWKSLSFFEKKSQLQLGLLAKSCWCFRLKKKRKHFPTFLGRRVFPKHNKSMAYGWVSAWISMELGHNLNTYGTDQWCHSRAYCWHHTTMKVAGRCNSSPHWRPSLYSSHCNLTKTKKEKYCIDLNLVKILLLWKQQVPLNLLEAPLTSSPV